jgi:predicted metal-binding protein
MTGRALFGSSSTAAQKEMKKIIAFAEEAGATRAAIIPAAEIQVENKLASYCRSPKCPFFGQSASCPPYVGGPAAMRRMIAECEYAIVLRIEVDAASLHGEDRPQVMRLLHEISAAVEAEAKRLGFVGAKAFAGGSCKASFCATYADCQVITGKGACRNPDAARPSMSGYGVNVGGLMASAGWSTDLFPPKDESGTEQLAWIAGLVLLR